MNEINRIKIIKFLDWNDKNGFYLDEDLIALEQKPFTLKEVEIIFWDILFRDELLKYVKYDNALELDYNGVYNILLEKNLFNKYIWARKLLMNTKNEVNNYKEIIESI